MNIEQRTNLSRDQQDRAEKWQRLDPRLKGIKITGMVFDNGTLTFLPPRSGKAGRPKKKEIESD